MNCRAAHRLLSAERDGTLATNERALLEAHLANCGDCRQARAQLAAVVEGWRATHAGLAVPDVERAWQDIHREIRTTAPAKSREWWGLPRWTFPLAAAAALAVAAIVAPRWWNNSPEPAQTTRPEIARADFVEVPNNSSSVVYVDDKSGWLVVWAVNDHDKM